MSEQEHPDQARARAALALAEQQEKGKHLFDGKPDARQSTDTAHKVSLFRPTYRALSDAEKQFHDDLKEQAAKIEQMIEQAATAGMLRGHRYKVLAMTALEEAIMWAVKSLTS